jgi:hypothetical protein
VPLEREDEARASDVDHGSCPATSFTRNIRNKSKELMDVTHYFANPAYTGVPINHTNIQNIEHPAIARK